MHLCFSIVYCVFHTGYCMARQRGKTYMATEHNGIKEEAQQTLSVAVYELFTPN